MRKPWLWICAWLIIIVTASGTAHAWDAGRVVVLGTEFYWYDTVAGSLLPLKFTGYSDYDLLTATLVTRTQTCLELEVNGDLTPVVPTDKFDAILAKLSAEGVNLLRIWAAGKHNARDWQRTGQLPGNLRNEHDLEPFRVTLQDAKYEITSPLDADTYLPRLRTLVEAARARNMVVMVTIFDNITLSRNGNQPGYRWGTSPWFWGNQAGNALQAFLPEDGFTDNDAHAYPYWHLLPPGLQATPRFAPLGAQAGFIYNLVTQLGDYGNVVFELMNEPDGGGQNSQFQVLLWHELAGLFLHAIAPSRVVVVNPTLHPDPMTGTFGLITNTP